jgi:superfamily II DNA or RNA helicase
MTTLIKIGYLIDKKKIKLDLLNKIKQDLTVTPKVFNDFGKQPESFEVFRENEKQLLIPKFYGLKNIGKPDKLDINEGLSININFNSKLRDHQIPIVDKVLSEINNKGGGLLVLPCGQGKTVLALYLATQVRKKTLVIVHKSFLLKQWKERIKQFTNAEIGIIQQNKVDIDGKDIVLGMLQSICKEKYDDDVFDDFGFVIFDEAHHAPAKYFSKALPIIACNKTLALSATPKRSDKMEKILHWYFGPTIYRGKKIKVDNVQVNIYEFNTKNKKFKESYNFRTKKALNSKNINKIVEIDTRNKLIIKTITELIAEKDRKILVLSDRLEHLDLIKEAIDSKNICSTGKYIGGMKEKSLNESEKKDVIFGTYAMASEGLDIPSLNAVILSTPRSEIEQSVGRILRKEINEIQPIIIDIIDNLPSFKSQGMKRLSFYQKEKYNIKYFVTSEQQIISEEELSPEKSEQMINPEANIDFI